LDEYLINKANKMNWETRKKILFEYCDKYKKTPPDKYVYKNVTIGRWIHYQKSKITDTSNDIYKELSENEYIKKMLDEYLDNKGKNLTEADIWNIWKLLLFQYCNKNKKTPADRTIYENKNIGSWLQHQKYKLNDEFDDIYIKLSENIYVKESLDKYLVNKTKEKLDWNTWKNLLFEYCNKNKKIPADGSIYKNKNLGRWLQNQKKKINDITNNEYIKLSENKHVKKSLDRYIINKENNKNEPKLDWDACKNLLFEYCNENKHVPPQKFVYKNKNIGNWLGTQKKKINDVSHDIYKKLSKNKYVKKSLDKNLQYKMNKN
jgi:hypothetical protein